MTARRGRPDGTGAARGARVPAWAAPAILLAAVAFGVWFFVFRESDEARALRLYTEAGKAVDAQDFGAAEARLLQAQRSAPRNPRILHLLGVVYLRENRAADARTAFERAAQLHGPEDSKMRSAAFFQLAQISFGERKWTQAALELEHAIAADPTQALLHLRLLDLELAQLRDTLAADSTTSRFLRLCGRTPPNLEDAAYVSYRRGSYARSASLARQAAAMADTAVGAHALVAKSLWKSRRIDAGLQYVGAVLERHPRAPELWAARGSLLEGAGRHDEALAALDRALQIAPSNYEAHYARLVALMNSGRTQDGLEEVEACLKLTQDPYEQQALLSRRSELREKQAGKAPGAKPGAATGARPGVAPAPKTPASPSKGRS